MPARLWRGLKKVFKMVEILREGQCDLSLQEQLAQMVILVASTEKGNERLMIRAAEKLGLVNDNGRQTSIEIPQEGVIYEAS